jgi:hypothetical protein
MPGAYHQQFGIYIQVASSRSHNPSLDELAMSHHLHHLALFLQNSCGSNSKAVLLHYLRIRLRTFNYLGLPPIYEMPSRFLPGHCPLTLVRVPCSRWVVESYSTNIAVHIVCEPIFPFVVYVLLSVLSLYNLQMANDKRPRIDYVLPFDS